jgi:membrane protein YqaA with SNARE-associated domain
MFVWVKSLYDWVLEKSGHPLAAWFLSGVSFIESSFFPVPPDVMLIPMCLGERRKSFWFATLCTVSSVLGGLFGYFIGVFLFESVGKFIIEFYGFHEAFAKVHGYFQEYGAWFVFLAGVTPIPYKVFTIGAGVFNMAILPFVLASVFGRGLRFYAVAALVFVMGPRVKSWIDRYFNWLTVVFFLLLVGCFYLLNYV